MRLTRHTAFVAVVIGMTLLVAGCAVGPNFHTPRTPLTQGYTHGVLPAQTLSTKTQGGASQHFIYCADVPAEWWKLFGSKAINDLVTLGIANSPNMAAAQAALQQAQDNWRAAVGSLFPAFNTSFSAQRQRFATTSFGQSNAIPFTFNIFTYMITGTWNLDVFGGIRRQIEAAGAQVDYQRFQEEATYLTLTTNIVNTAINIASLEAQIRAYHRLASIQQGSLRIVSSQFRLGAASQADVLAQQTQLAQTLALIPPTEKSLATAQDNLAVLVGVLPSQIELPAINLDCLHLPTALPLSVPSLLVRQRPDVRAAEAQLHAALAQIGVAIANTLPQFPINAYYGFQANQINKLFTPRTMIWSVTGKVTQPLFQGGTLVARRQAAIDAYKQAAAQYRQTVLQAFQNVADALSALTIDAAALQANMAAESAAHSSLRLTQQQFRLGAVDYLNVLNAQYQYSQAQIYRIQSQAARYSDTAALFQALGGGWWNRAPLQIATPNTPELHPPAVVQQTPIEVLTPAPLVSPQPVRVTTTKTQHTPDATIQHTVDWIRPS